MSRTASTRLDFTAISDPRWRLAVKEYVFALLPPAIPRSRSCPAPSASP